jgi:hypothetical protein
MVSRIGSSLTCRLMMMGKVSIEILAALALATSAASFVIFEAVAAEDPYDLRSATAYLSGKAAVATVLEIDGPIDLGSYAWHFEEYADPATSLDELDRMWRTDIDPTRPHRLLVVRSFRGAFDRIVEVRPDLGDIYTISLGQAVVAFFDHSGTGYRVGVCDTFPLDAFPRTLLRTGTVEELIAYIVEHRLGPCLRAEK